METLNAVVTQLKRIYLENMGHPGLEPGTNRLKAEYSTIELVTLAGDAFRTPSSNLAEDAQSIAINFDDYCHNELRFQPTAIFLAGFGSRSGFDAAL